MLVLVLGAAAGCFLLGVVLWGEYAFATGSTVAPADLEGMFYVGLVASVVAVPVALMGGVPGYYFLKWRGLLNGWSVTLAGTLLGAAVGSGGFAPHLSATEFVGLGAVSGFLTWRLLKRFGLAPAR